MCHMWHPLDQILTLALSVRYAIYSNVQCEVEHHTIQLLCPSCGLSSSCISGDNIKVVCAAACWSLSAMLNARFLVSSMYPYAIQSSRMAHCAWTWQAPDLGAGTLQRNGTWYCAFGANMSTDKLTHTRGITPLESAAGSVPGWNLVFNHRSACTLTKLWLSQATAHPCARHTYDPEHVSHTSSCWACSWSSHSVDVQDDVVGCLPRQGSFLWGQGTVTRGFKHLS